MNSASHLLIWDVLRILISHTKNGGIYMKLIIFLVIGYYLFSIIFLRSIYRDKALSIQHKVVWSLVITLVPFLGAIVYVLINTKQYGRPNELMTIIR